MGVMARRCITRLARRVHTCLLYPQFVLAAVLGVWLLGVGIGTDDNLYGVLILLVPFHA